MAKKFYAVKVGKIPGIYETWDECQLQIKGFSGAIYKSFSTLEEAEKFIINSDDSKESKRSNISVINQEIEEKINSLSNNEVVAFVDGSYSPYCEKIGFGAIIIDDMREKYTSYKSFDKELNQEMISYRNVAAELEAVKEVLEVAVSSKKKKITIYYDYEGIEKWATKEWKTNNELTKGYVEFICNKMQKIDIQFIKVPAHCGVLYNEEADALARESLLAKGHKTYKDGSVYFTGYSIDDWQAIIQVINDENSKSLTNENYQIKFRVNKVSDSKQRIIIANYKDKVSINLYNNNKSYVQGKQSVLFKKIISTAIEFLTNEQTVIETLNSYHALTIQKYKVEECFEKLLPNFKGKYDDKIYSNLLSAVYNTMLTGYMPDYTCLLTPIFRSYEYCLHKILGEIMGLKTAHFNGTNNFAYFEKRSDGLYECNNPSQKNLTKEQLDLLNNLYTNYNAIRHPYSHWSADDYDTAMISDISVAREYLKKGLNLVDGYYKLF